MNAVNNSIQRDSVNYMSTNIARQIFLVELYHSDLPSLCPSLLVYVWEENVYLFHNIWTTHGERYSFTYTAASVLLHVLEYGALIFIYIRTWNVRGWLLVISSVVQNNHLIERMMMVSEGGVRYPGYTATSTFLRFLHGKCALNAWPIACNIN